MRRLVATLVLASGALHAMPASAQDVEVSNTTILDGAGDPLEGGGSATPFAIDLPDGATCQGDSADENYRVDSYMVPEPVDPATVVFSGLGPEPNVYGTYETFQQPLYDVETTFFVAQQTENAEEPGDPGRIIAPPLFDLDVYGPGDLPVGRYHVGIACTLMGAVTRAWDTTIEVVEDPADEPAGIRWTAVGFESDGGDGSGLPTALLPVGGAAVLLTVVLIRRGRTRAPAASPRRNA